MTSDVERCEVRDAYADGVRTIVGSPTVRPGLTAHSMLVRLVPPAWRSFARRSLHADYSDDGRTVTLTIRDEEVSVP